VILAQVTVDDVVATVLYGLVGGGMLVAGFVVLDLLTPGSLVAHIRSSRSRNAAALAIANLVAVGLILAVAGLTSGDTVGEGLLSLLVYGGLGIGIQALFLVVIERRLRQELHELLAAEALDPMATTLAVMSVMIGVLMAVAVS
jgi:uncharacterized membrane protein YjfL (UPF0719 family)